MAGAARDPRSGAEAPIEGTPTTAFGKYQLFASLGRGGMADVFLSVARGQMGFNKLAVIKRLRQALAEEPTFRNMFLDEARLAARLTHPNIVHTYEVGEQNGVYFIAMEYLEGQSLNKVLKEALRRKETIEPVVCVRIIADALAGLGHAHEVRDYDGRPLNIIHRDISPHNIFVTYDGHTKLVDFGIAKAALSSTETEVGVLKGKVAYMSPEQAMGTRIDCRSDLFAMGIVLWELLARQRLMTGESAANTLHKLMNEPIPRLSHALPSIDPVLDNIVARALEKDPALRWPSATAMRDALESWLAAQPRTARQDDVGRQIQHLFASLREEVQRAIQRYMASTTPAANTQELQALSADSLKHMELSGANVSGQLLRLGTSGSGSGVVPSYGMGSHPSHPFSHGGSHANFQPAPGQAPKSGNNVLLIVIAIGFFSLAALLILVIGLRKKGSDDDVPIGTTGTAAPIALTGIPATGAAITTDDVTPALSAVAPDTAMPPATATTPTTRPTATAHHTTPNPPAPKSAAAPVKPLPPPVAPAPAEDPGYLTISVYPWVKVSEGGRVICAATPCNKLPLSPGGHTLLLEGAEQSVKQTTTVMIKSGETTTKNIALK